jgi:hypothetical protein
MWLFEPSVGTSNKRAANRFLVDPRAGVSLGGNRCLVHFVDVG